jgi:SAM-dependent methyltransferase
VQASTFNLPFAPATFDVIYSRGVLQHTYSPREALLAVAEYCRPGGRFSVSVRGPGASKGTLQHAAHAADVVLRPILSLAPRVLGTALLTPIVLGAMGVNRLRRHGGDGPTFDRALHSARDRFTPRYAHRHEASQVVEWFREAGFEGIEVVGGLGYHMGDRRNNVRGDRPNRQNEQASSMAGHL